MDHRLVCGALFLGAGIVCCAGAGTLTKTPSAAPTVDNEVVSLSPYEVIAMKSEFHDWVKVASQNYVVYTDARVKEAMDMLRELELLHFVMQGYLGRRSMAHAPMIYVLPTSRSDWRKLESKGAVEWKAEMSGGSGRVVDCAVAQYDWIESGLGLVRRVQARVVVEGMGFECAFWFDRGISSFFETARFEPDRVTIGRPNSRSYAPIEEGWLPWRAFFEVTGRSKEYRSKEGIHRYEGQCAAFVQFMLTNEDRIWTARLFAWNALLTAGREPTEELFKRVFDVDFTEWEAMLAKWMDGGKYLAFTYKIEPAMNEIPRRQLPLNTTEMRELFVLTQIIVQDIPASEESLDALLVRGLKTECLRELLVEACVEKHRFGAVDAELERLIEADPKNPRVFAMAAAGQFQQIVKELSVDARLGAEAESIRTLCRKALEIEPHHTLANEILAWTEAFAPEVNAESVATIRQICRTLDGNGPTDEVIGALAVARSRTGDTAGARRACQILLNSPFAGHDTLEVVNALIATLDPPAESARPAAAAETPTPAPAPASDG